MSSMRDGSMQVVIEVPASVANLGPGFDAMGMALGLYNRYIFSTDSEMRISIAGEGASILPRNETHLAYRSCAHVLDMLDLHVPGLVLDQENHIPFAGGLGNSATAVVAGVLAANSFAGGPLSSDELLDAATAIEGHPDNVAPALLGGLVVCAKKADGVVHLSLPVPKNLRVVLAVPGFTLDTALSRQALPKQVPLSDATFNISRASLLVAALCTGQCECLAEAMQDRLHQPYRAHLIPGFTTICAEACKAGAAGVALAGAGPTIMAFSFDPDKADGIGASMVRAFRDAGVEARYLITKPCMNGATVKHIVAAPAK